MSRTSPLVFRIRNGALRRQFAAFVAAESKRIGYRLNGTEVAERAIAEFMARTGTPKRGQRR